jgi:hypothetical protein
LEIDRAVELEIPDIQTPTYETRDDII